MPAHARSWLKHEVDSGWAWIVCASSFTIQFIVFGIIQSFGIFFISLLREFRSTEYETAWIGSMAYGLQYFMGPLTVVLCDHFGCRKMVFSGTVIVMLALFTSSFAQNVPTMYFTFGILWGIGASFAFFPCLLVLRFYFSSYISIANGITMSGAGIGTITFNILITHINERYGWRVGMRAIAGIAAVMFACGSVYLPPPSDFLAIREWTKYEKVKFTSKLARLIDIRPWKHKAFVAWVVAMSFILFGYFVPFVHLVRLGETLGVPVSKGALLIGHMSISQIFGKLLCGRLADVKSTSRLYMFAASATGLFICNLAVTVCEDYTGLLAYSLAFGFFDGCFVVLVPLLIGDIVGISLMSSAIGGFYGVVSIPMMLGPPVAGQLFDKFQTYDVGFITAALLMLLGISILYIVYRLKPELTKGKSPLDTGAEELYSSNLIPCQSIHSNIADTLSGMFITEQHSSAIYLSGTQQGSYNPLHNLYHIPNRSRASTLSTQTHISALGIDNVRERRSTGTFVDILSPLRTSGVTIQKSDGGSAQSLEVTSSLRESEQGSCNSHDIEVSIVDITVHSPPAASRSLGGESSGYGFVDVESILEEDAKKEILATAVIELDETPFTQEPINLSKENSVDLSFDSHPHTTSEEEHPIVSTGTLIDIEGASSTNHGKEMSDVKESIDKIDLKQIHLVSAQGHDAPCDEEDTEIVKLPPPPEVARRNRNTPLLSVEEHEHKLEDDLPMLDVQKIAISVQEELSVPFDPNAKIGSLFSKESDKPNFLKLGASPDPTNVPLVIGSKETQQDGLFAWPSEDKSTELIKLQYSPGTYKDQASVPLVLLESNETGREEHVCTLASANGKTMSFFPCDDDKTKQTEVHTDIASPPSVLLSSTPTDQEANTNVFCGNRQDIQARYPNPAMDLAYLTTLNERLEVVAALQIEEGELRLNFPTDEMTLFAASRSIPMTPMQSANQSAPLTSLTSATRSIPLTSMASANQSIPMTPSETPSSILVSHLFDVEIGEQSSIHSTSPVESINSIALAKAQSSLLMNQMQGLDSACSIHTSKSFKSKKDGFNQDDKDVIHIPPPPDYERRSVRSSSLSEETSDTIENVSQVCEQNSEELLTFKQTSSTETMQSGEGNTTTNQDEEEIVRIPPPPNYERRRIQNSLFSEETSEGLHSSNKASANHNKDLLILEPELESQGDPVVINEVLLSSLISNEGVVNNMARDASRKLIQTPLLSHVDHHQDPSYSVFGPASTVEVDLQDLNLGQDMERKHIKKRSREETLGSAVDGVNPESAISSVEILLLEASPVSLTRFQQNEIDVNPRKAFQDPVTDLELSQRNLNTGAIDVPLQTDSNRRQTNDSPVLGYSISDVDICTSMTGVFEIELDVEEVDLNFLANLQVDSNVSTRNITCTNSSFNGGMGNSICQPSARHPLSTENSTNPFAADLQDLASTNIEQLMQTQTSFSNTMDADYEATTGFEHQSLKTKSDIDLISNVQPVKDKLSTPANPERRKSLADVNLLWNLSDLSSDVGEIQVSNCQKKCMDLLQDTDIKAYKLAEKAKSAPNVLKYSKETGIFGSTHNIEDDTQHEKTFSDGQDGSDVDGSTVRSQQSHRGQDTSNSVDEPDAGMPETKALDLEISRQLAESKATLQIDNSDKQISFTPDVPPFLELTTAVSLPTYESIITKSGSKNDNVVSLQLIDQEEAVMFPACKNDIELTPASNAVEMNGKEISIERKLMPGCQLSLSLRTAQEGAENISTEDVLQRDTPVTTTHQVDSTIRQDGSRTERSLQGDRMVTNEIDPGQNEAIATVNDVFEIFGDDFQPLSFIQQDDTKAPGTKYTVQQKERSENSHTVTVSSKLDKPLAAMTTELSEQDETFANGKDVTQHEVVPTTIYNIKNDPNRNASKSDVLVDSAISNKETCNQDQPLRDVKDDLLTNWQEVTLLDIVISTDDYIGVEVDNAVETLEDDRESLTDSIANETNGTGPIREREENIPLITNELDNIYQDYETITGEEYKLRACRSNGSSEAESSFSESSDSELSNLPYVKMNEQILKEDETE